MKDDATGVQLPAAENEVVMLNWCARQRPHCDVAHDVKEDLTRQWLMISGCPTCTGRLAASRRSTALWGPVQSDGSAVGRLQRSAFCRKQRADVTLLSLPASPKSQDGTKYIDVGQDHDHVRLGSQALAQRDVFYWKRRQEVLTLFSSTQLSGYIVSIQKQESLGPT